MVLDLPAGWLHRHNLQVREGTEVEVEASGEMSGGKRDWTEGPNAETVVKQKGMRIHPRAMVIDYGEHQGSSTAGQIAIKCHLFVLTTFRSFCVLTHPLLSGSETRSIFWTFHELPGEV